MPSGSAPTTRSSQRLAASSPSQPDPPVASYPAPPTARRVRRSAQLVELGRRWSGIAQQIPIARLAAREAHRLWPHGGLAILLAAVMWPAWWTTGDLIVGGDALLIHYPWFVLWRDLLAAGEPPFWNPYAFGGMPAFATLQAGYGYPPHWAFTWVPPIPAMNWLAGLHVLLAGLGAAWCASQLGASKEGQFLSGAAYALGSAMVARLWAGHLSFLEANAWLPLATGLAVRVGRPGGVGYLALVIGLMALAGQPEVVIFSLWWIPLWAAIAAHGRGWGAAARALARSACGLGLGVGLAAFQLLPVAELFPYSNRRADMSWEFLTGASLPPWHLLGVFAPLALGDPRGSYWPGPDHEWHERLLFVGAVSLAAAALAPGRWRWTCWGLAAVAVALALGRYAPWYAWTDVLPGYRMFRVPSKHLTLAALALALAAGLGVRRLRGRRVAIAATAVGALLWGAGLTFGQWFPALATMLGGSEAPAVRDSLAGYAARPLQVAGLFLALTGVAASLPATWSYRAATLLAVLELVLVLQPFRLQPSDPQRIVAEAEPMRGHARAAVVGDGGAILGNYGPVVRVTQPVGYVSLFSGGYMALLTGQAGAGVAINVERGDDPVLALLGYGVVVDPSERLVTVRDPTPPRVWVARCAWPGAALQVREPDFPRESCITRSTAAVRDQPVPPGPAAIRAERPGRLLVEAEGPGWLVTTEPWYPGWAAWVDGVPAPVEVVDGALVGLFVPEGAHAVALRYRPAGLELGLLTSGAASVVVLALWWHERRRVIVR
jgi:hypothetical protein